MNPSASGWVNKHLHNLQNKDFFFKQSPERFYIQLRSTGFIYANNLKTLSGFISSKLSFSSEELTKINLLESLAYVYVYQKKCLNQQAFYEDVLGFYSAINETPKSYFHFLKLKTNPASQLEGIIQERIQINNSVFKKNLSRLITNALLFIDILAFQEYLTNPQNTNNYYKNFEKLIAQVVYKSFKAKTNPNKYDHLILETLKNSFRFLALDLNQKQNFTGHLTDDFIEKLYLMDIACITVFNDEEIDNDERSYIFKLGRQLNLSAQHVNEALRAMHDFFNLFSDKISYFQESNALNNLYQNTNRMVKLLVLRNKSRILQELTESKELVGLLGKSTYSQLSLAERKKVKTQLLDICKTVPSLAIFILPGGSVLLPILIKFIPQLLPSAFNENRLDN